MVKMLVAEGKIKGSRKGARGPQKQSRWRRTTALNRGCRPQVLRGGTFFAFEGLRVLRQLLPCRLPFCFAPSA